METQIYLGREEGIYELQKFAQMLKRCFSAEIGQPNSSEYSVNFKATLTGEVLMRYDKRNEIVKITLFGAPDTIYDIDRTIKEEHKTLLAAIEANRAPITR